MLNELTKEQQDIALETKNFWLDFLFSCKNEINKEQATEGINFLYELAGLEKPEIIFCDSPFAAQNEYRNIGLICDIGDVLNKCVRFSIENPIWRCVDVNYEHDKVSTISKLKSYLQVELEHLISYSIHNNIMKVIDGNIFSHYCNTGDYAWVSYYDYHTKIGTLKNENFDKYKKLLLSGIFSIAPYVNYCVVVSLPNKILINDKKQLHSDTESAISFRDGFELFFKNGLHVDKF